MQEEGVFFLLLEFVLIVIFIQRSKKTKKSVIFGLDLDAL